MFSSLRGLKQILFCLLGLMYGVGWLLMGMVLGIYLGMMVGVPWVTHHHWFEVLH